MKAVPSTSQSNKSYSLSCRSESRGLRHNTDDNNALAYSEYNPEICEINDDEAEPIVQFVSLWASARLASEKDSQIASSCVWPEINDIVRLRRVDLYQNDRQLLQIVTCTSTESQSLRKSGQWRHAMSFFTLDKTSPLTKEIEIYSTTAPKRDKVKHVHV